MAELSHDMEERAGTPMASELLFESIEPASKYTLRSPGLGAFEALERILDFPLLPRRGL